MNVHIYIMLQEGSRNAEKEKRKKAFSRKVKKENAKD
jgi:hypothetical protein